MADLPTGTVTFLFTDIEGSTKLAQGHPAAWESARQRHHVILRETCEAQRGYVFRIIGDAFCVAFPAASNALRAALAAQHALHSEAWGEAPIRVRMGLHTGAAEFRDGDYHGYLTLAQAQRVMSAAFGGQTLVSNATAGLLAGQLPEGASLRDMQMHRLKGFANPEQLWQVVAAGMPQEFPPLQTLDAIPNNLPIQVTSFVGREKEIVEVKRLLETTRLLTLTGTGGMGKTRMSLQVAAELLDQFPDGAWFVELAPLSDPALVPQTVASALSVREQAGRPMLTTLAEYLGDKQLLLILDNCEHLIDACAQLADTLLHAAPKLKVLASSREALGIAGETAYRVPSLSLPDPMHLPALAGLAQYEAVRLFVERATQALTTFRVTNANAPAVAQICYRLDGIPLAIELAAARVKVLPVEQIAARLDDRFRLLTGGGRTALPRQQTLRGAIDWSYDLLPAPEQLLLRRLAVFEGGWTLDAAEEVTKDEGGRMKDEAIPPSALRLHPSDVLDLLAHLVDKSLVLLDEQSGAARYHMLETIRQYAREKLDGSGEYDAVARQHHAVFLELAAEAEPWLQTAQAVSWFDRLESEHANFRAALNWASQSDQIVEGLRLAGALSWFWAVRNFQNEGFQHLHRLLANPDGQAHSRERAKALTMAGLMLYLGNQQHANAQALLREALVIGEELNDPGAVAFASMFLGMVCASLGDLPEAAAHLEKALALGRQAGDPLVIAHALRTLGEIAQQEGDARNAKRLYEESLAIAEKSDDIVAKAQLLRGLAEIAIQESNYDQARSLYKQSMALNSQLGDKRGIAGCLLGFAHLEVAKGATIRALKLCGAVEALTQAIHTPLHPGDEALFDRSVATLRGQFSQEAFDHAWADGRALTPEQAIEYALGDKAQ